MTRSTMVVLALACASVSACATVQSANRPDNDGASAPKAVVAAPAAPVTDAAPGSATATHLQQLIDSNQVTRLRTTCNATYGASLLFQTSTLNYYVALFHNKQFWRVIQVNSYESAESLYRTFAAQTQKLAQVDIDRMRLQAGNAYAEHLIALDQHHLQNLQQDANYQQQQARQVAAAQQQAQQEAASLSADLRSTSGQLEAMKQRIHALEQQQTDPSLLLPAAGDQPGGPTTTTAPAAASSSP